MKQKQIKNMKKRRIINLRSLSAEQLCELFNECDSLDIPALRKWDIIQEFIDRKISVVNIQRASGSMSGREMRIMYNKVANRIEVAGHYFFEDTSFSPFE